MDDTAPNTHNLKLEFGKHKGERWTRIPVSYLKWLANNGDKEYATLAKAELDRRGTTTPDAVEISGHALDRASQITDDWKEVGVWTWLVKLAEDALEISYGLTEIHFKGFKLCFFYGAYYPVLKTIMKSKHGNKEI